MNHPKTPDGRYFVVRERLWRCSNPSLSESERKRLVAELMTARRAVKSARASGEADPLTTARAAVNAAKVSLGERGPTWWDGDQDHNRVMVHNSPYAHWWDRLEAK